MSYYRYLVFILTTCAIANMLAGAVGSPQTAGELIERGPAPSLTIFYTSEVSGYIEPHG